MIDGIQLTFYTPNPKSYLLGLPCWEILVNEKTGQRVNDIRTTHLRGLDLKLKPSINEGYNLLINGSLHKFHNCGEHNADQFTFAKLLQSIDSLIDILGISADKCLVHGLEIGVNVSLPFSPLRVLKNLVCYRSRPFTQINKRNISKGLQCSLTQYRVKVYDKAKQSDIDCGNVLRFEVAVDKMQVLSKYGIVTLADLQCIGKVKHLIGVLEEALNLIVWTDTTVNLNKLSNREQKQWLYFSNPKTWQQLSKFQKNRSIKKWGNLLYRYGNNIDLKAYVVKTWEHLFEQNFEAENPQPFYQHFQKSEAEKNATFLPLVCTVKKLRNTYEKDTSSNTIFYLKEVIPKQQKRYCLSCGREITNQPKRSIFCSEKLYGKSAKKCRNKSSNKRRDRKRFIRSAMKKNIYLAITYTDETGTAYTDILHPSEIIISKEWIDKIQTITNFSFDQKPVPSYDGQKTKNK